MYMYIGLPTLQTNIIIMLIQVKTLVTKKELFAAASNWLIHIWHMVTMTNNDSWFTTSLEEIND